MPKYLPRSPVSMRRATRYSAAEQHCPAGKCTEGPNMPENSSAFVALRTISAAGFVVGGNFGAAFGVWLVASVLYDGVVLTAARGIGEFGAVAVVSGNFAGQTQTATLRVQDYYENLNTGGIYGVSLTLAAIAIVTLILTSIVKPREERV